ncbi:MAG: protein kinase [Gemmatimonadales bacterium]|nr:protein kinase [Gemmatimonadales bacterium]NIN11878.1 protein kinase [Gemmatimonadales bacterium]NIN50428.1 protein kinase [Gemmatimonadales bacterium]NIP07892.1 protein kinase [Gemmatimonadales bacterium]NIR01916.1 protein kinase [Gemmatimonadales bacterium]
MSDLPGALRTALSGRYDLQRVAGRGGMATVYMARDIRHSRQVAVKVLLPDLAASLGVDRFLNEIEIAASLTHPHIVPLYDSGQAGGFLYYVMPFIDGESLRALLNRERCVEPSKSVNITTTVAEALTYAHRMGVLHRDIKPENILLAEGHPLVTDFGIAKAITTAGGERLTRSGFPLGTPGYMSPEQAAGIRDLDARTDVYSLACVSYEMLIGETPGLWLTEQEVRLGRFIDASREHRDRLDRLPGRLEQVLAKALAMRRNDRFASPAEFVEALRAALARSHMLSDAEVRQIIQHAADAQAANPTATDEEALSVGAVEQIAAQVGIPPARVREAMEALEIPAATAASPGRQPGIAPEPWSGFLGSPTTVRLERTVEGEVPESEYSVLVEEVRATLRNVGSVSTLGRSLTWSAAAPGQAAGRNVHVTVTPYAGRTRIHIEERLTDLAGAVFGGICGGVGGGLVGIAVGLGLGALGAPIVALLGVVFAVGGTYTVSRSIFVHTATKRERELSGLADRLADLAVAVAASPRRLGGGEAGALLGT